MEMLVCDLPDEVLYHIFRFVSGGTLLQLRCVCSHWYRVISHIVKKPLTWKERCFAEIAEPILLDLTFSSDLKLLAKGCVVCGCICGTDGAKQCCQERQLDPSSLHIEASAWLKIYMMWWRSRKVGSGKELKTLISAKAAMTAVKYNGDYIVGATKVGTIEIWNHLTGACVANFLANFYNIVDLKLIPLQEFGINSLPKEHLGNMSTTRLVTAGIDRSITVYDIKPDLLNDTYRNDTYWKNSSSTRIVGLGIWSHRIIGTSAEILHAGHKVLNLIEKKVECYLAGHKSYPQCIDFWKNKVLSGTTQGNLLRWRLDDCPVLDEDDSMTPMLEAEVVAEFHNVIVNVIYRDSLILLIKSPGTLCISTDDGVTFCEIFPMEILSCLAKLVALKGTLFALCTSSGLVFLYHMDDYKNFDQLDLSAYK
ncbi:uncharacterized protein LOC135494139 isoform X2 [Lineus longissimus]